METISLETPSSQRLTRRQSSGPGPHSSIPKETPDDTIALDPTNSGSKNSFPQPDSNLPQLYRPKQRGKRWQWCCFHCVFMSAALLGLYTNLLPVVSLHMQRWYAASMEGVYDSIGIRTGSVRERVLFQRYHEPASPRAILTKKILSRVSIEATGERLSVSDFGNATAVHKRPSLVIHMGPHKTASTTLQTDLTYYRDRLLQDGYVYLGRLYHPIVQGRRTALGRTPDSPIQTATRDMFQQCHRNHTKQCVEDLRDLLVETYQKPFQPLPNLLISDEAFLKLFDDHDTNTTIVNENYVQLQEVLGEHWDVVIVLAYRRFFEWLPSAKYQKDKPTENVPKRMWPHIARNGNAVFGVPLSPLFPITHSDYDFWKREHFFSHRTVQTLVELKAQTSFNVQVYHLYSKLGPRTIFLCNVLKNADYSCRASLKQDARTTQTRANVRAAGIPQAFFDVMATAAVEIGLIDKESWLRQDVANKLKEKYYEQKNAWYALQSDLDDKAATLEPNEWEIGLVCPSMSELDQLLFESLTLEATYLPKLYRKGKEQHRHSFYKAVIDTPTYCWINVNSTLVNASSPWTNYIIDTFPSSTPETSIYLD